MEKGRKKEERKEPIMPVLKGMMVGDSHSWNRTRINTVKVTVGQTSAQTGFKFKTKSEGDKVTVTRIL